MYVENPTNPIEFQGHRSRSHEFFWCFSVCAMRRLPACST